MKKIVADRLILIEAFIILLPLIGYYIIGIQDKNLYPQFLINSVFVALLLTLFIFRSSSIRHMYFGVIFLVLTIIGNVFGFNNFVYIASSFTLSLFILGVLNMFLFTSKES